MPPPDATQRKLEPQFLELVDPGGQTRWAKMSRIARPNAHRTASWLVA